MNDVLVLDGKPVTVGSSDVASILGLSRWGSPWSTWCRLVGLVPRYSITDSDDQQRGRMFEPAIGQRWCWEHREVVLVRGWQVIPGPPVPFPSLQGPHPFMACRPDFLVGCPGEQADYIIEAKSCRYFEEEDGWTKHSAPIGYVAQATWQAACLSPVQGVTIAAFATIQEEYREYPQVRNERLERKIVARVWDWYEKHVLRGDPPPIDGSDGCADGLAMQYPGPDDDRKAWKKLRKAPDAEDLALQRDIYALDCEIRALTEARDAKRNQIRAKIGDAYGIRKVAVWFPVARTTIDTAKLRNKYPQIAEDCTVTAPETRNLRVFPPDNDETEE